MAINYNTKAEGMTYTKNDQVYVIKHGIFRVIDFAPVPDEHKIKIHIQNKDYDDIIIPFVDENVKLEQGSIIRVAYIIEKYQGQDKLVCHGYELNSLPVDDAQLQYVGQVSNYILKDQEVDYKFYKERLITYLNLIQDYNLKAFINYILGDFEQRLKTWPAAVTVHHNIKGGLILHTTNVVRNAIYIAKLYSDVNLDLVIAGALLHDLCKVYEYNEDGSVSQEGMYKDHITMMVSKLHDYYYRMYTGPSITEVDFQHLCHIVLSHHGKPEWGSAKIPATKEAFIVHQADYIDTQMYIYHNALKETELFKTNYNKYVGTHIIQTKIAPSQNYDLNS